MNEQGKLYCSAKEFKVLTAQVWSNAGRSYTKAEEARIIALFIEGWTLENICEEVQRPPSGVLKILRKCAFVAQEEEARYEHCYVFTKRGASARDDWRKSAPQRAKLAAEAAAATAKEDGERLEPVNLPGAIEGNPQWPNCSALAARQSEGRLLRKDKDAPTITYLSGEAVTMGADGNLHLINTQNVGPQDVDNILKSFNNIRKSESEKIMSATVKIETRVYLNNKLASSYSDTELMDMVMAQENKIKFLKDLTDAPSVRRNELMEEARQDRDDLLALLDSRAKGGKSALEVSNEVQAREAKAEEVVAKPQAPAAE